MKRKGNKEREQKNRKIWKEIPEILLDTDINIDWIGKKVSIFG